MTDDRIRQVDDVSSINVDVNEFMTVGAGRFAIGRQFEIINDFFTADSSQLHVGTYTKVEIAAIFGLTQYGWIMHQSGYQDSTEDYAERTYIYNSESFKILDNAIFVVEPDGRRYIKNFGIVPTGNENFDFLGGGLATYLNPLIEPIVDPSHIGRTVNINFIGSVTPIVYDGSTYFDDLIKISAWKGLDLTKLAIDGNALLNNLWDLGTTKFLTANEQPIIYGTDNSEKLDAEKIYDIYSYPTLAPYADNGVVLIAGKGDDSFIGSSHDDIFDGGEGFDSVKYDSLIFGNDIIINESASIPQNTSSTGDELDIIVNVERIDASSNDDNFEIKLISDSFVKEIHLGAGDDTVSVFGSEIFAQPMIFLGDGDDVLKAAPRGGVVYGEAGADSFELSRDVLIADADTKDKITYGGYALHGGVRWVTSESPWAVGLGGVRYGKNKDKELVIQTPYGENTYVANFNFDIDKPRTAGILIGDFSVEFYHLYEIPKGKGLYSSFEAVFGYYLKALTGISFFLGVDPLVLDLDGDGLELNARTSIAPFFDVDGDGFAEQTGWVRGDDAFLARDLNGNGKIDSVKEMFGNDTIGGFAALAGLDSNNDGKISASDVGFADLFVWKDTNGNAATDAGELLSLAQAGIAAIGLSQTAANTNISGNIVTATGSFTRVDGSVGKIADVSLRADQRDTIWLGDKTIDAVAASLPEIKGFGTLTNLRIAMTDSTALKDAVQTTLPKLNSINLGDLRKAITPVLNAWIKATPVEAGTAGAKEHVDVPILTKTSIDGTDVTDFAYKVTDSKGSYWKLASNNPVYNAGKLIERPTFESIIAQTAKVGSWSVFEGAQIQFLERYLGTPLPIGENNISSSKSIGAAHDLLNDMWDNLNNIALRLAVQGPLAQYFVGIKYNAETNNFEATSDYQLAPTIQAIFAAAPTGEAATLAYLATWKPVLETFLQSFDRGGEQLVVSYAFLFKNIVAAYENVGLSTSLTKSADAFGIPTNLIHAGVGTIVGGSDADIFYLGVGNQTAKGGLGPDTYVVGKNFGKDVIDDVEPVLQAMPDSLRFAQYNANQLTMSRTKTDLIIQVNGTSDSLRIVGQFALKRTGLGFDGLDPEHGVQEIIFADGTVWDKIDIAKAVSTHTNGNDSIKGTGSIDFLDGGMGNDTMDGGDEGDIYSFGTGYGKDTIIDKMNYVLLDTPDILQFKAGVTPDMLSFTRERDSSDLVIKINGTTDQITIKQQFDVAYTGITETGNVWINRIEGFVFADGKAIAWDDVFDMIIKSHQTSGNDSIYGFSREDILNGGAGDDYLSGGNENDTYIFGWGYGHDTIQENKDNILSGGTDKVRFNVGIKPSDVSLSRIADSKDLILTLSDGSSLKITEQFTVIYTGVFGTQEFDQIERFEFSDGTVWTPEYIMQTLINQASTNGDDAIYGFDRNDIFTGGKGNDYLAGGNGSDTYIFNLGDGADTISDSLDSVFPEDNDKLVLGANILTNNIIIERYGEDFNNVKLSIAGTNDSIGPLADETQHPEQLRISKYLVWRFVS